MGALPLAFHRTLSGVLFFWAFSQDVTGQASRLKGHTMPLPADLPTAHLGRYLTFADLAKTSSVPVETIFGWHRTMRLLGFDIGAKKGKSWHFNSQEIYQFNLCGALSRAGFPVSADCIRQVMDATRQHGRPETSIFIETRATFAIVAIDAGGLWDTLAHMLERVEEGVDVIA